MASEIKDNILKASLKLFYEQGYNNTSLRQIADACDIKIGNLYYYYKKKIDLIIELSSYRMARNFEKVVAFSGKDAYSYTGLVADQYMFLNQLKDPNTCRMFVEASTEQELMDGCVQVHHNFMIKFVGKDGLRTHPIHAFFANNYACAGEIQIMNYYYNYEALANLDELIIPCLFLRLFLLGLPEDEAKLYTDEGIALAKAILEEADEGPLECYGFGPGLR